MDQRKKQKLIRRDLKNLYESIPETEGCVENIAKENGCGAWCCETQNPQVMFSEFINTWDMVEHSWKEEEIILLIQRCIETYFRADINKGCVFWDTQTKFCKIHEHRPFNCRIYAQTPESEFKPRFEKLKILYPDADIKDQCNLCKTKGKTVTVEDTDLWFNQLKLIETDAGIHPSKIFNGDGGSYLTFHDHILMKLCKPSLLAEMTKLKEKGNKAFQDAFVRRMVTKMRKANEEGNRRKEPASTGKNKSS